LHSLIVILKEIWDNKARIFRLSRYEQRARNSETVLGKLWDVLTPVLQICVYWFVFSVGLNMRKVDDIPYAVWMICGMIPWFTISSGMMTTSTSISSNTSIIRNLNIPLSIIPTKTVVTVLTEQIWMLAFLLVVMLVSGIAPSLYWLQMIYYFGCMVVFLIAFALLASSIGAVLKDFPRFLSPIIRLLFYLSSAIMSLDGYPQRIQTLLKINPATYVIMGYRNSLLYHVGIWETLRHGACFWVVTLLLLWLGCALHMRTRKTFVDIL